MLAHDLFCILIALRCMTGGREGGNHETSIISRSEGKSV